MSAKSLGALASFCYLLSPAGVAADNSGTTSEVSEVVVTGTYIRSNGFTQSSPIDVVSGETIKAAAAIDVAHLLAGLPAVSGSSFSAGTAQAAQNGGGNINLRGLGAAATLVLVNGKRATQFPSAPTNIVDINYLLPQIAIGRIDILKDGASALYGTDAVGGVVNFVTRDRFQGVETSIEGNRLTEAGSGSYRFQVLGGTAFGDARVIGGFEFNHVDATPYSDLRASRTNLALATQTFNYNVPSPTGVKVVADPNCGIIPGSLLISGRCAYDFWPATLATNKEDKYVGYVEGSYEITSSIRLRGEASYGRDTLTTSSGAAQPLSFAVTVPASNPGNPFGAAVTTTTRIIGTQGGLPTGGTLPAGVFERGRPGAAVDEIYRAGLALTGDVAAWNWEVSANYSHYKEDTDGNEADIVVPNLVNALKGLGGPACDPNSGVAGAGNCHYFNPFLGSAFASPGSAAANTTELVRWIMPELHDIYTSSLTEIDAIVSGSLFKLPAGPLGVALGTQFRRAGQSADYAAQKNTAQTQSGVPSFDFNASRDTKSVFVELSAPVFASNAGKLNVDGAARYETFEGGLKSTDPKFGLTYATPNEMVMLRATWGTSFLAPSLFQQFSSTATTGGINLPGGALVRPSVITTGNPNLTPQTAESYSVGAEFKPIARAKLSLTYWHTRFSNLIATQNAQQLVTQTPTSPQIQYDPITGLPVLIRLTYFNAAKVVTSGFDLDTSYALDFDTAGTLDFHAAATYVDQYDLQATPTSAVLDRVGNYNATTFAFPSVRWKAAARANWSLSNHLLAIAGHYRGPFTNDSVIGPFSPDVPSFTTADIAYTYALKNGAWHLPKAIDALELTLGANNVLDKSAPGGAFAFYFGNVDDYRGRILYVRVLARF